MIQSSKKAVYAALFGNLLIAIFKLIAAVFTGSTAMIAETLHSFSDTFNQLLLLIGIKTSNRAATEQHPFGYGKDRFFWSFVVSTLIFGISGVLALEKGISDLLFFHERDPLENIYVNYIILGLAAIFEGYALRIAYKIFKSVIESHGEKATPSNLIKEFHESKDPALITVLVEDSAALLGILIAAIGIFLSDITSDPIYDSIASIAIGIVLMAFAFFLAKENRALLIGEAISKQEHNKIIRVVNNIPEVSKIITLRSMHFSPEDVLVAMEVSLVDNLDTDSIELVIDNIEDKIKQVVPYINKSKIFIELKRETTKR